MTAARRPLALAGTWTALATPFRAADLSLDLDALDRLVDAQIAAGVDVLVPCGTTGESPTLSHKEHDEVVARVVTRAAGRVPVVAGTGSNSTAEAERLTRHAAESGADGALVVCPYYNRPSQRMLFEHFRRVAAATPLPIVLYNIPGRTGVNLEPETVAKLRAEVPTIAAIKEATGSLDQASRIRGLCDIPILSGDDALVVPLAAVGATGVISVASNIVPKDVIELVRAATSGDAETARARNDRLQPLFRALFREPNPVPLKCAMQLLGTASGAVRPPLYAALPETERALRDALRPIVPALGN